MRSATLPPLTLNAWLRYDALMRLWPTGVSSVLEVGCGQGALGARLAAQCDYLGLEPDPVSASVARARLAAVGRGEVREASTATLSPDDEYDVVCAFEVIEHVEDDQAALAEWVRHVRPGGWLVLSTPADPDRFGPADEIAGHFRRYEPAALAALLTEAGLTEVRVERYGAPLGYALERARNVLARRATAKAQRSVAERTQESGRWHQPRPAVGLVYQGATLPFRLLQRRLPDRGVGLLARARRPW